MLQVIRSKANNIVVKALFGLLAATFALWGIGDIFRNWGTDTAIARVGSKEVSSDQLNLEIRNQLNQLRSVLGQSIDMDQAKQFGLVNSSLQRIVGGYLIDLETDRLGLVVGDEAVRQAIISNPNFAGPSGAFDRTRYTQLLAANQLNEAQYEASMRQDLVRTQLTTAVVDGMTAPGPLVDTMYRSRAERRSADIVTPTPAAVPAPPAPTEDQLKAFYDGHKEMFLTQEQRGFSIALLKLDDVASTIKVPDDKLKAEYDKRPDEFQGTEERNLQQMLLPDEAKAKAAKAQLDAGKDFAAVAKSDAGSDAASTDLGWVKKSDLPDQLASVAFGLAKGKASDPVQTSFGWHILRVTDIKPGQTKSFESVKDQLSREVSRDQAGDQIAKTANDIDDALAGGNSFDTVVQKFGLKTQKIAAINAQGQTPDGKPADLPQPADVVLRAAFGNNNGETSPLSELGDDGYFIVHVDKVDAAVVKPLADAHAQAVTLWQADQKKDALNKLADSMIQQVKDGKSFKDVAAARKLTISTTPALERLGSDPTVPPALVAALFNAKQGGAVSAASGENVVVGQVKTIEAADPAKDADNVKQFADELSNQLKTDMMGAFDQSLRGHFPVEINQSNLDHL